MQSILVKIIIIIVGDSKKTMPSLSPFPKMFFFPDHWEIFVKWIFSDHTETNPPMDKTTVFYIAVGVACSIILVIALAVAAIHVHSMPSPNKDG